MNENIPDNPVELEQFILGKAQKLFEEVGLEADVEVMETQPFLCILMILENLHYRLKKAEYVLNGGRSLSVGEALDS